MNIGWVSVGVADMAVVRALWVEQLGLEIIARRVGPDAALAGLWGIPAEQIEEQLLLGTPGSTTGRLHFVQFHKPQPPVREGAAPTDLGAKNLDVNCVDMPQLVAGLKQSGYEFRSAIAEYEIDSIQAREVQMPVHDALNLVLIEVLSKGFEVDFTNKGYAALTSFVVIVPDVNQEVKFYERLFGMQNILAHKLSGKAIEEAAGLPSGTVLDLHLLGDPKSLFGRMELIEYVGVGGADLFSVALPPATGILGCGFVVRSLEAFSKLASANEIDVRSLPESDLLYGRGRLMKLSSPAGLAIQIFERT
jgi:catechol 2,3-dioxygenase-like lactoylglutathione lyase family enzyme